MLRRYCEERTLTNADLISLLRDSLRLWGVAGRVAAGEDGVTIAAAEDRVLAIRKGRTPTRWWLTTAKRTRPAASIGALLDALRVELGIPAGARARIGAGASFRDPAPPPTVAVTPPWVPTVLTAENLCPVVVVTGFLGSGKTTLISRLLRSPALARTAVIVNEFGEIGLDHDLIERGDDTLLQLTTGCLCCAVQTSIVATLLDLQRRREAGDIDFDRVLIETSGLADPAPILHAMMTDDACGGAFAIGAVASLIDAQLDETTLRSHPEAARQVEFADLLLITKTDLAPVTDTLVAVLRELNPTARLITDIADPGVLFSPHVPGAMPEATARHTPRVTSIVVRRDAPIPALALTLFVQALSAQAAGRLLRLKGIAELAEMPGRPIVLHGVQHIFSPPVPLAESKHRSGPIEGGARFVVIGQDMPTYFPARLLQAIIGEVEDEARLRHMAAVSTPSRAAPINAASDIGRPYR